MDNEIKIVIKKNKIQLQEIKSVSNSFNSKVFILIDSNDKKYIIKFYKKNSKRIIEKNTLENLKDIIKVPKLLDTGIINNNCYNLMEYVTGKNYLDEEYNKLSRNELLEIGNTLYKFHQSSKTNNINTWITYLKDLLSLVNKEIESNIGENNNRIIQNYLLSVINTKIVKLKELTTVHMDFRIGNIIINDYIYFIDFESVKYGDPLFDFSKSRKIMSEDKFNILLQGYFKNISNELELIDFYLLFDSYTSLYWSIKNNDITTKFYQDNIRVINKFLNNYKGE